MNAGMQRLMKSADAVLWLKYTFLTLGAVAHQGTS